MATAKKTVPKTKPVATRRTTVRKNTAPSSSGNQKKKINLALQGGGAHGAFAWGVLDKFLEDGRVEIEGISGLCLWNDQRTRRCESCAEQILERNI